jgi:hypothetical protein
VFNGARLIAWIFPNQATDHRAISAEGNARDFVGFSSRGGSPLRHGSGPRLVAARMLQGFYSGASASGTDELASPHANFAQVLSFCATA